MIMQSLPLNSIEGHIHVAIRLSMEIRLLTLPQENMYYMFRTQLIALSSIMNRCCDLSTMIFRAIQQNELGPGPQGPW